MEAQHIYILGVRSSSFLAGYLHFYFHLIFEHVTLVTENSAGDILEKILRIGPEDVLVGITFPRYSSTTAMGVRFARDRGARIIAVTDGPASPLYDMAIANLTARSDMISFVDSLVAPLQPSQRADCGGGLPEEPGHLPDLRQPGADLAGIRGVWKFL